MKSSIRHIALIPDGNRRWARAKGLLPWQGHLEGAERFKEVVTAVFESGIPYCTFWAASADNIRKRSKVEVAILLRLFKKTISEGLKSDRLIKNRVQVRVVGEWQNILKDKTLQSAVRTLEEKTALFAERHLTILFGYDGKSEMLEAMRKINKEQPKTLTEETVKSALWTAELPSVDFVIRTGGEPHWSAGFMMWLTADSQFYFTEKFWPDFNAAVLQR